MKVESMQRSRTILLLTLLAIGGIPLGFLCFGIRSEYLTGIGSSITATALTALFIDFATKGNLFDNLVKVITPTLSELSCGANSRELFLNKFEKASSNIDIMAISLKHPIHIYRENGFFDKLENSNCHIRILIMVPESVLLQERAKDEPDESEGRLNSDIKKTKKFFEEFKKKWEERCRQENITTYGSIRVRMFDSIPYRGFTRFDNMCYVSPYLSGKFGVDSPLLQINSQNSLLYQSYLSQFNVYWERSKKAKVIDIGLFDEP